MRPWHNPLTARIPRSPLAPVGLLVAVAACGGDSPIDATTRDVVAVGPLAPAIASTGARFPGGTGAELLTGRELDPFSLPADVPAGRGSLTPATVTLPVDETYGGGAAWAFRITQEGSGNGGWFRVNSPSSANRMALLATHTGEGLAMRAINTGTGRALWAQVQGTGNPFPALVATTVGSGEAIEALNFGFGPAGVFEVRNGSNDATALAASTEGSGHAASFALDNAASVQPAVSITTNATGSTAAHGLRISHEGGNGDGIFVQTTGTTNGDAADFFVSSGLSEGTAVQARTAGTGFAGDFSISNVSSNSAVLRVTHAGTGDFANFRSGGIFGTSKARIAGDGEMFSDVGFSTPSADVAESFAAEGSLLRYEPGDVLVISTRSDRRVEKSAAPYSTLVAGVYASEPGLRLGHGRRGAGAELPVGVIGVIPTRVSAENGPIGRGDLLVTSGTPGHAMRATESRIRHGSVLGKALEPFEGPGRGVIDVLVNVR